MIPIERPFQSAPKGPIPIEFYNNRGSLNTYYLYRLGDEIALGHPLVMDYGATFGTVFHPDLREDIAQKRGEKTPREVVSLVATYDQVITWIDKNTIHQDILCDLERLKIFENVAFLRFAANHFAKTHLPHSFINSQGEIQVFMVPNQDPFMKYLREKHHVRYVGVRSANMTGEPEQPLYRGAYDYAKKIQAKYIAVHDAQRYESKPVRRYSQPIVRVPKRTDAHDVTHAPVFSIVRAGNTEPYTLTRLIRHNYPWVVIQWKEEKPKEYRVLYSSQQPNHKIQHDLLRASGLIR